MRSVQAAAQTHAFQRIRDHHPACASGRGTMVGMESSADTILDGLDDAQRLAATSVDGPVRIIACAGAGKTRTITRRIAYACANGAWHPGAALAVTFSVKAANEMRGRLTALGVADGVHVATFHSAALAQLRDVWNELCEGPFPQLIEHKTDVVSQALVRALNHEPERRVALDVEHEIDWCKVSLIAPDDYARVCAATHREPPAQLDVNRFADVYRQYELEKTARLQIDFNDILLMCAHVLDAFPDAAAHIRERIGWLTVDEYQDVSPLQHRLLRGWLGDNRNICVVGDPAQTIYSFAGATSYYLDTFADEFAPVAANVELSRDYRSTPPVVSFANRVLARSPERDGYLRLQAVKTGGPRVTSRIYETDAEEAYAVAAAIQRIVANGGRAADCAVLTRINGQQAAFVRALRERGIPYQVRRDAGWQQSAVVDMAPGDASAITDAQGALSGRVTVSTIHAAKGLEFPTVFLVGLSDGLMPFHASDDPTTLEEERRVLYVGVTRAEEALHLSYARCMNERSGFVRDVSRFLR